MLMLELAPADCESHLNSNSTTIKMANRVISVSSGTWHVALCNCVKVTVTYTVTVTVYCVSVYALSAAAGDDP